MSVLIQYDQAYTLYIKGADSIIKSRLDHELLQNKRLMPKIQQFLDKSAAIGLRTLLVAKRQLSSEQAQAWLDQVREADLSEQRDQLIPKLYDQIERGLTLLGCTAVEDKLQDNVPQTIEQLQNSGIHIWMLTGDKLQTAENIAKSCRLFLPEMMILKLQGDDEDELSNIMNIQIDKIQQYYREKLENHEGGRRQRTLPQNCQLKRGILIEAIALNSILNNKSLRYLFLTLAAGAEAVVCSRVSPAQKAEVVRLIKTVDSSITTLAIGDGANDVSMILQAHIGIGLHGNEGMQSVQASDFALAQFQHLKRLLLHHGRLAYFRISQLILYFFYKNMVFTLPQVYYAFVCAFSAQTVFDDWYISLYNTIFTAIPLMIKAIYEVDVHGRLREENAHMLYYLGQNQAIFNTTNYIKWVLQGIVHSIIVFAFPYYIFERTIIREDGLNGDLWNYSVASFTSIILIVSLKLMNYTRLYNWLHWASISLTSVGLYLGYMVVSNYFSFSKTHLSILVILSSGYFYFTVLFTTGFPILFDFFANQVSSLLLKNPTDYLFHKYDEKRTLWQRFRKRNDEDRAEVQMVEYMKQMKQQERNPEQTPEMKWEPNMDFQLDEEQQLALKKLFNAHRAKVQKKFISGKLQSRRFGIFFGKCCCKGSVQITKENKEIIPQEDRQQLSRRRELEEHENMQRKRAQSMFGRSNSKRSSEVFSSALSSQPTKKRSMTLKNASKKEPIQLSKLNTQQNSISKQNSMSKYNSINKQNSISKQNSIQSNNEGSFHQNKISQSEQRNNKRN